MTLAYGWNSSNGIVFANFFFGKYAFIVSLLLSIFIVVDVLFPAGYSC